MRRSIALTAALALALGGAACSSDSDPQTPAPGLTEDGFGGDTDSPSDGFGNDQGTESSGMESGLQSE